MKAIEIQQRQEEIRFQGYIKQLKSLYSSADKDARESVEAVKDFMEKLNDSKIKIDSLYGKLVEASVMGGKEVTKNQLYKTNALSMSAPSRKFLDVVRKCWMYLGGYVGW